ncbi:MAG: aldo/keto reductase [Gluconacetobacter diazotrophicus]|nr:aldo/keto reductase [Gluconacetobacter diazotrophicus]
MEISRRRFLQTSSATVAASLAAASGLGAPVAAFAEEDHPLPLLGGPAHGQTRRGDMVYRPLGRTGETVSLVGVGGAHLSACSEDEAIRIARGALDRGVNFLDNCWDYGGGRSEERMGKALRDGYRAKAFLMTKIDGRDRATAARQIDESLARLGTDHLDLLQHHEILRTSDADRVFAPGGSMEAVVAAKKAGKVRFIGFTGHKDPAMHLHMFAVADQHGFHFDTVQMPLNVMDAQFRSFAREVVPAATRRGVGVLAMKTMGCGFVLKSHTVSPVECLHYAMSLPVATVITGMDKYEYLDQACEAVRTYQPFDRQQVAALLERTRVAAAEGKYERYKVSEYFDGTTQHPEWMG